MLRCSVCGDELMAETAVCAGCGAAVTGTKKSAADREGKENISNSEKNVDLRNNSKKKSAVKEETAKPNSISSTKLFYLLFSLLLIGALLVYASGVLDTTPSAITANAAGDNPHSGVDLNNLQHINNLQATVDKNPNDTESLLHLAHLLNDSGMKEKAIERYIQYLKTDPKNPDVLVDMGVCYFETGKNKEAISAMEKAIKINPKHQIANLNLGIVNMTAGNFEKAKVYWNKAVEINPNNEIGQKAKELLTTH
ncbi:MAG: hypothetical protein CVV24_01540 [Ignavibacteriae bacterium HGW-Ignavibacteriae-3]|nr:MAG: hypothetical protein CVV24_01540 [Ignavibacteriae bacterium HGW-Ignavibacteriae-3]